MSSHRRNDNSDCRAPQTIGQKFSFENPSKTRQPSSCSGRFCSLLCTDCDLREPHATENFKSELGAWLRLGDIGLALPVLSFESGCLTALASLQPQHQHHLHPPGRRRDQDGQGCLVSTGVTHPSTNRAQHCLTSVFEWELVFPMRYGRYTNNHHDFNV